MGFTRIKASIFSEESKSEHSFDPAGLYWSNEWLLFSVV